MASRELQLTYNLDRLRIDPDSCNESESEIVPRKKRRLNVLSTSESEEIEENCVESAAVSNMVWTTAKFEPKVHHFNPRNSEIQSGIRNSWKIIDYFQLFVSKELMQYVVEKTNSYWQQKKNNNDIIAGTDLSELYCFIAICFLMTRNKRLSLAEHWSRDKLLRSDIFSDIMSRDRYFLLLRMLYFSDDQVSSSD